MFLSRRLVRAPVVAVLALFLLASSAAAAGPSTVTVRVLGAGPAFPTLLPLTQVTTTTSPLVKDGGSCSGTSAAGALDLATKGNWQGSWNSGFGDYEVLSIEGQGYPFDPTSQKNYYWSFWLNGTEASTGVCGAQLETGNQVLFFPGCFGSECPPAPNVLGIEEIPTAVEAGSRFTVKVVSHPGVGGAPSPAVGAVVSSEGASGETDSSGHVTLTLPHAGSHILHVIGADKGTPSSVPGEAAVCVHQGNDGTCGFPAPSGSASTTTSAGSGGVAGARYTGPSAIVAKAGGAVDGHVYKLGSAPRLLQGTVSGSAGLQDVKLRLTRTLRHGGKAKCSYYDGPSERFRAMRCGAVHGRYFSVGAHASVSYLLPSALAPGRYVLDLQATDTAGNQTKLARGTSRIVFYVS